MIERTVTLHPEMALHARPAAKFVQAAKSFSSKITVSKDGRTANAVSPISLMSIDAGKGSTVILQADGSDEELAIETLGKMLMESPQ